MGHQELQQASPGIILGTEPYQDVNAGLAVFPARNLSVLPGPLRCKVNTLRVNLLKQRRVPLPTTAEAPPSNTLTDQQLLSIAASLAHAQYATMAALSRAPLAGVRADTSMGNTWSVHLPGGVAHAHVCQLAQSMLMLHRE